MLNPLRIPSPDHSVEHWHVSPLIDTCAYAFSWVWVMIPLSLMGNAHPVDYLFLFLFVAAINFTHRHLTFPYVYLDRQIFRQFPLRFTVFPAIMVLGFIASPFLWNRQVGSFALSGAIGAVIFIAGAWNVWHVYAQKYGILRLYNAKSGNTTKVPPRVDRYLIFGWVPLYIAMLPEFRGMLARIKATEAFTMPMLDAMEWASPVTFPLGVAAVLASIGIWLHHEWKANGLRNTPRLVMALGMTGLSSCFVLFNPMKGYLAFAFSHSVEYIVFVWAFQRRRYQEKLSHDPLLGRLLKWPWTAYVGFIVVVGGGYFVLRNWGYYILPELEHPTLWGTTVARWVFFWGVYQSMMHFYFDGFLWKMRVPALRANL